jgi:uncharacterized membrane protein YhfC
LWWMLARWSISWRNVFLTYFAVFVAVLILYGWLHG